MPRRRELFFWVAFAGLAAPAATQGTGQQFRPELGIYVQQGELIRIEFIAFASGNQNTNDWEGHFAGYIEIALKPVLRRSLSEQPDVYRNKYLTMRAGYRRDTSLTSGQSRSGNIGILELTSRYQLPGQFVISDRNRGGFRFIQGQAFSPRYRNRLRLERDLKRGWFACTPYVEDEIFFDTRYGRWTPNVYALGVQIPAGRHVVYETYYMRQN